jgi:hypothetical protein
MCAAKTGTQLLSPFCALTTLKREHLTEQDKQLDFVKVQNRRFLNFPHIFKHYQRQGNHLHSDFQSLY